MIERVEPSPRWWRSRPVGIGSLLFVAGFTLGALLHATADRTVVSPDIQNTAILGAGAIITGLLAMSGAYVAAERAAKSIAQEGERNRAEARRLLLIEEKTALVRKMALRSYRHVQEIADQVAARRTHVGQVDVALPVINPTTELEDAVNELYALGFQSTADLGAALLTCLEELDEYKYTVPIGEPITALPQDDQQQVDIWRQVQLQVKTHMIDVSLTDKPVEHLAPLGTLAANYLSDQVTLAVQKLHLASAQIALPPGTIVSDTSTYPFDRPI